MAKSKRQAFIDSKKQKKREILTDYTEPSLSQELSSKRKNFLSMTGKLSDYTTARKGGGGSCNIFTVWGAGYLNPDNIRPCWSVCGVNVNGNWYAVPDPWWNGLPYGPIAMENNPLGTSPAPFSSNPSPGFVTQDFTDFYNWVEANLGIGPLAIGQSFVFEMPGYGIIVPGIGVVSKICFTYEGLNYITQPISIVNDGYPLPVLTGSISTSCCVSSGSSSSLVIPTGNNPNSIEIDVPDDFSIDTQESRNEGKGGDGTGKEMVLGLKLKWHPTLTSTLPANSGVDIFDISSANIASILGVPLSSNMPGTEILWEPSLWNPEIASYGNKIWLMVVIRRVGGNPQPQSHPWYGHSHRAVLIELIFDPINIVANFNRVIEFSGNYLQAHSPVTTGHNQGFYPNKATCGLSDTSLMVASGGGYTGGVGSANMWEVDVSGNIASETNLFTLNPPGVIWDSVYIPSTGTHVVFGGVDTGNFSTQGHVWKFDSSGNPLGDAMIPGTSMTQYGSICYNGEIYHLGWSQIFNTDSTWYKLDLATLTSTPSLLHVIDYYPGAATNPECCDQQIDSWNCTPTGCVDPGDGSGQHSSLTACQAVCVDCSDLLPLQNVAVSNITYQSQWAGNSLHNYSATFSWDPIPYIANAPCDIENIYLRYRRIGWTTWVYKWVGATNVVYCPPSMTVTSYTTGGGSFVGGECNKYEYEFQVWWCNGQQSPWINQGTFTIPGSGCEEQLVAFEDLTIDTTIEPPPPEPPPPTEPTPSPPRRDTGY